MKERDIYRELVRSKLFCMKIEWAPGGTVGVPDLVCLSKGKVAFVECKLGNSSLSAAQRQRAKEIVANGGTYLVLRWFPSGYRVELATVGAADALVLETSEPRELSRADELITATIGS